MIRQPRAQAFTMVEMLVAMAVLSLLVVILSQVVALTEQAITLNVKNLNAAGQARLTFDRLGADLASRPVRIDLPMSFSHVAGNDSFQFYSQVDGYSLEAAYGARHFSVVGYRIQETTPGRIFQLERGAAGTDWATGTDPVVVFSPQPLPVPVDADSDVLGRGVFRLEFCYLLNTGLISNGPPPADWNNVAGIVVAMAILDNSSRQLLSNPTAQLQTLSNALQDPAEGADPISTWNKNLSDASYAIPGIPPAAMKNIRLYQRTFRVP
jgi:prepilin-type N-terminal cleavage/methylation domain-containing protein